MNPARLLLAALLLSFLSARPADAQVIHDVTDVEVALSAPVRSTDGLRATTVFQSDAVSVSYDGVALQGSSADTTLQGWVRFEEDESWSVWEPLYLVRSATDDAFLGAFRGGVLRPGGRFEVRFETRADAGVSVTEAGVFDTRRDDVEVMLPDTGEPFSGKTGTINVIPPSLITRADWNAASFIGSPEPLAPRGHVRMTFHHAAGFGAVTKADGLAQVRAIQAFHQNGRGWSDIGYHLIVDQSGRVYQGRPFLDASMRLDEVPTLALGAHVGGFNTGNIGICVLGCYHPPEPGGTCTDVLSPAARDSLVVLFAFLSEAYQVAPSNLLGHRDQLDTSCPGDNNYALLPELRTAIVEVQQRGLTPRPDGYALAEPAPQPVRDRTTLRYYLPTDGLVYLTVYDVTGREVARLVDGSYDDGERWHEASFDASGLASGVYLCRMRVEGYGGTSFVTTRRLVVVR